VLGAGLEGYDPTVGHCGAWTLAPNAGTPATGGAVVVASRYSSCLLRSSAVIGACAQTGPVIVSAAINAAPGKKEVMAGASLGDLYQCLAAFIYVKLPQAPVVGRCEEGS
jgi:hypothetical protein